MAMLLRMIGNKVIKIFANKVIFIKYLPFINSLVNLMTI